MNIFRFLERLHDLVFSTLSRAAGTWFTGLFFRLAFSSVLLMYFLNSAKTKIGSGFPDFLIPGSGAYMQILPTITEAAGYDTDAIAFIPYGLIVTLGTYAEFIFPVLILVGLFTRAASLSDQRLLWIAPLVYLTLHGPGSVSLDRLLGRSKTSG